MCGLTASYSLPDLVTKPDFSTLEKQLQHSVCTLSHRGPDSWGAYVSDNGYVGLGHARLAIIDLQGGQQPLHSKSGHIHAIVNGEFYDYAKIRGDLELKGCQFKSQCDSELIIHLYESYGLNLLSHLRGEFAFVLYDSQRHLLFAARDRFGIKPLFYTLIDGGKRLLLASEMKAFLPFGWKAEWDIESIVQMGDFYDDRTVFRGVQKLPSGHYLTFRRSGKLKVQAYWEHSYPHPNVVETRTVDEMVLGLRKQLVDAVKVRLRSDVPVGVYLSGGIDSAAIAGIATSLLREKDLEAKVVTFTLSFPDRPDLDEGPIAQRIAANIGAETHMITPSEADLVAYWEKSVFHAEQPVSALHGAGRIILSETARKYGYPVILTGEGSDEILGGYSFVMLDYLREIDNASKNLDFPLPTKKELDALVEIIENTPAAQDHISISDMSFKDYERERAMLGGISMPRIWATTGVPSTIFDSNVINTVGEPNHVRTIIEGLRAEARHKASSGQWHPLNIASYTATNTTLANYVHSYVGERTEMANSIEGRPAFLDHFLVEYVNTLPPSLKVMPKLLCENEPRKWMFVEKWVLREAVKPFVTDELYQRKKSQYNVPISQPASLTDGVESLTPVQRLLNDRLTKEAVDRLGWADWDFIGSLLQEYLVSPQCPADGGLDKRARVLLCVLSFVVLQEKFSVTTARVCRI